MYVEVVMPDQSTLAGVVDLNTPPASERVSCMRRVSAGRQLLLSVEDKKAAQRTLVWAAILHTLTDIFPISGEVVSVQLQQVMDLAKAAGMIGAVNVMTTELQGYTSKGDV